MANRRERRAIAADMRQASDWGPWEDRSWAREHPLAPAGLQRAWLNSWYSVQLFSHRTAWGEVIQLMIRRHDAKPIRSWADMQRIKDELIGGSRTGIEVYPARAQLRDSANIYHLWILPEGFELPFGLHQMGQAQ